MHGLDASLSFCLDPFYNLLLEKSHSGVHYVLLLTFELGIDLPYRTISAIFFGLAICSLLSAKSAADFELKPWTFIRRLI